MAADKKIRTLVKELGEPYSAMLGIDLRKGDPAYFKWFLAAFLYAKPIREETATKTFKIFESEGLDDPQAIVKANRSRLITALGRGGYARYDESTTTRLQDICENLQAQYGGKLSRLYAAAEDSRDLEKRILELGKGIGPVTASVFLRDMRSVWPKADPPPTPRVKETAKELGIRDVKRYAREHDVDLVELETALHRCSRELKRREKRARPLKRR